MPEPNLKNYGLSTNVAAALGFSDELQAQAEDESEARKKETRQKSAITAPPPGLIGGMMGMGQ